MKRYCRLLAPLLLLFGFLLSGCSVSTESVVSLDAIPAYSGDSYVAVNGNIPFFTEEELTTTAYEDYGELDYLNRCGEVSACVGLETMPTEERGSIGHVKPSGWQTAKYDCVDGKYLYNRCHLIGFQLTGENARAENLITGTRYLNVDGMLPFENMVADYVQETGNHVLYRVTPIFDGEDLVAQGVLMEAWSVEDEGDAICFNVFCYNVQPGVSIDYATGESWLNGEESPPSSESTTMYVVNLSSEKFHEATCGSAEKLAEDNRLEYFGSREDLIAQGYDPCGSCKP
ncbi:MAG: DNA/RNA non-specific endonuclease [Ruminiclostridium sp.]|nr:DNA/RNA non-specific endonuclease [Ruminiclostridium sp.]